ncbi:DUF6966 domain-containing protein [Pseudomonas lini]
MRMLNDFDAVLTRMIELLRFGGEDDWAVALEKIKKGFDSDPRFKSSQLLSMYGGMGSLNDIVLYRGGQPLVAENNEFDELRIQLYELCRAQA